MKLRHASGGRQAFQIETDIWNLGVGSPLPLQTWYEARLWWSMSEAQDA